MRPKKPETTGSTDLFRARLDQIINLKHELAQLAGKIDWDWIDGEIAPLYSDKGRPGIETRFAIGLLLLKHIYKRRSGLLTKFTEGNRTNAS
jgi:transposase, IS5 family